MGEETLQSYGKGRSEISQQTRPGFHETRDDRQREGHLNHLF